MKLRPYQDEAVRATLAALFDVRSTLIVMPTGTGKTLVFASIAQVARRRGRILVLAHREELLDQAADKIRQATGLTCGIEQGERRVDTADIPDVVVASVQSLARESRRSRFAPDAFVLVIIDEAHHATAKSYAATLDHFGRAKLVGVTATPDRLDGRALRRVFESVAYVYEIRQAIADRWLVPIRQKIVRCESLDLSQVRTLRSGDYADDGLAEVMLDEAVLHEVAGPLLDLIDARPTILFAPTVAVATALADVVNTRAGSTRAVAVSGRSSGEDRAGAIRAFAAGERQVLVNCALLTEGFDAPPTACVAVARPTKSRALYAQMIGRGTRISPETGKTDLLVLDFTGRCVDHTLMTPAAILDGDADDETIEQVGQVLARNPDMSVDEALTLAEAEVAAMRRISALGQARYRTCDVDPFTVLGIPIGGGRGMPATQPQIDALLRFRVDERTARSATLRQAQALLDALVRRARLKHCTYPMARQLSRFGLRSDVSFADAGRAMEAIAAEKWKRAPAWLFDDPAFRTED